MPGSGPRSRGARVLPRPNQGHQPWPRTSGASGLVLATQNSGGITGRALDLEDVAVCGALEVVVQRQLVGPVDDHEPLRTRALERVYGLDGREVASQLALARLGERRLAEEEV